MSTDGARSHGAPPLQIARSDDELLTAAEASAFLKLSRGAFYAWRRRHRIPSRIEGRALRFFRSDLVRGEVARPPRIVDFAEAGRQFARDKAVQR